MVVTPKWGNAPKHGVDHMAQATEPQIIVDTSGIQKELADNRKEIAELKKLIQESRTPEPKPESLNEAAQGSTDYRREYKQKLAEAIKNRRTFRGVRGEAKDNIIKELGLIKASEQEVKAFSESFSKPIRESLLQEGTIPAITTTSALPDVWAAEVERLHVYANSKFLSVPGLVKWKTDIQGAGTTVEVVTVGKAIAVAVDEGTEPTTNAATVGKIQISLTTRGCAYYLTEADVEDIVPSTIDALNAGLGSGIAEKLDSDFYTWASAPASGTNIGGTLTTAILGTVAMSGSILARAMGSMRSKTYEPAFFFCHPQTVTKMMQNQQFYDASQFGTRDVIERGAIANYYGVDFIQTPVVYSTGGTYKSLLLARGAMGGVMKRTPVARTDYIIESGRNYVKMTARYGGTPLHSDGIWQIDTSDAT